MSHCTSSLQALGPMHSPLKTSQTPCPVQSSLLRQLVLVWQEPEALQNSPGAQASSEAQMQR